MTDPVVMFCVGAAKAGTSWLHRYLSEHPDCHFRAIKELHYFNSLDAGSLAENRARVLGIRERISREAEGDISPGQLANKVRNLAQVEHYLEVLDLGKEDREAYLTYLCDGLGDAKVVGELTPAYSLLPQERLGAMASIASDVRFVYLLRDPVDRLWSHVRMIARQRCKTPEEFADRAANILSRVFRGKEGQIERRCDYAGPLARLGAAIAPEKLFIGVYEEFFSGDCLARICAFLGIAPMTPKTARIVNAGEPLELRPDQRGAAADWLSPQYQAVRNHFGSLPKAWDQNLARVS